MSTSTRKKTSLAQSAERLRRARQELETAALEVTAALSEQPSAWLRGSLQLELPSLKRAMSAVENAVERLPTRPGQSARDIKATIERAAEHLRNQRAQTTEPSLSAKVLAVLLEAPGKEFDAASMAERVDCSVPVARTTLNRLADAGHVVRAGPGKFRA